MAITNGYGNLDDYKDRYNIDNNDHDNEIELYIEAVSRVIDGIRGERFFTTSADETRYFTATEGDVLFPELRIVSITTLKTDNDNDRTYENTWATTDYDLMPYNPGNYVNWGDEPAWRNAPLHRVKEINWIDYQGDSTIDTVKSILSGGLPVTFCMDATEYSWADNFILSSLEYDSDTMNHAQAIVGYNDSVSDDGDVGAFKVVNSWGSSFADNGYYWITYEAIKEIGDIGELYLTYVEDEPNSDPSMLATWEFSTGPTRDTVVELGIGDHDNPLIRAVRLKCLRGGQDPVVGVAAGQRSRQLDVQRSGLKVESAGSWENVPAHILAQWVDRQASVDFGFVRIQHELVEETGDLSDVSRHFRHALLAPVELFEHHHRQEDIVLLKSEDGCGIVHKHIGVQHEQAGRVVFALDHGCASEAAISEFAARHRADCRGALREG